VLETAPAGQVIHAKLPFNTHLFNFHLDTFSYTMHFVEPRSFGFPHQENSKSITRVLQN